MAGQPIDKTPVAVLYRPGLFSGYTVALVSATSYPVRILDAPTVKEARTLIDQVPGVPGGLPWFECSDFSARPWEQAAGFQGGTYTPRQVEVEARRYTVESRHEVELWAEARARGVLLSPEQQVLQWDGPDGEEEARVGDWLVRLPGGRLVKHSAEEFELLYRPVQEG